MTAHFAEPLWLVLLLAVPLWWAWAFGLVGRRGGRVPLTVPLASAAPRRWLGLALLALPRGLVGVGLAMLVLALARPVQEEAVERTDVQGINLVLAVDVSESMETTDLRPSRLEAAQQVAQNFVQGLRGDRVGVVVFAEAAFILTPLTLDYGHVTQSIGTLSTRLMPKQGTAVGEAIGLGMLLLDTASASGGGAIILLTDGANNRGDLGPRAAAQLAGQRGVRIYAIQVGRDTVERNLGGGRSVFQQTENSPETLQAIARLSNGNYYEATEPGALERVFFEISRLEKSLVGTRYERITRERFPTYVAWGVGLLALGFALIALGFSNPLAD